MVERLSRGPASVTELAAPLAMSLPAVMQHLRVLEASGLVRSEKAGRVRTCRIEPAALQAAEQWIADRRAGWVSRLDRLGEYLTDTAPSDPSTLSDVSSGAPSGSTSGAPSGSTSGARSGSTSGARSGSTSGARSGSTSGAPSDPLSDPPSDPSSDPQEDR
jgi:DNA-binding transcriptional ArsR family regulator